MLALRFLTSMFLLLPPPLSFLLFLAELIYSSVFLTARIRFIKNLVPLLTSDWTLMSPFMLSTILLLMLRPSPVPFLLIWWVSFSFPNVLNNFLRSILLIPTPVSSISIWSLFNSCCWKFGSLKTEQILCLLGVYDDKLGFLFGAVFFYTLSLSFSSFESSNIESETEI